LFAIFSVFGAGPFQSSEAVAQGRIRGVQMGLHLTASDVAELATWNVNAVRYQLHWDDFAAADASNRDTYFAWLNSAVAEFDALLPAFEQHNIKVILNLHTPPGAFARRDAKATHRLFTEAWAQQAFLDAWQMLATKYNGRASIIAYDMLNEPAQFNLPAAPLKSWQTLAQETAALIRSIEPSRTIIMTPPYGDVRRIKQLKPLGIPNVIYTFHFYQPFRFLHQGLLGIKFGLNYPTKKENKAYLIKQLKAVQQFQKKNKARIYIGEFSAIRWAPKNGGIKYLKDIVGLFEKYKWDWTYHAFREANSWSLEHGTNRSDASKSPAPTDRLKFMQGVWRRNAAL
jgi:aryl-phospho-beta-D-glucosidase BglC (GH1 family)